MQNYQLILGQKYPEGTVQGQCAAFCERLAKFGPVGDLLSQKVAYLEQHGILSADLKGQFQVGDILITNESTKYGHVAFVNSIDQDNFRLILTESNYYLDEKVHHTRSIPSDSKHILGVIRAPLLFLTLALPGATHQV